MLDPTTIAPRPRLSPQHACDCCDRPLNECEIVGEARAYPLRSPSDAVINAAQRRRDAARKKLRYRRFGHERRGRLAAALQALAARPGTPADHIRWLVDQQGATHVQFNGTAFLTFAGVCGSCAVAAGADTLIDNWRAEAYRALGSNR